MSTVALERGLLGDLWVSPDLWETLAYLCDGCNGRFAGTDDERRARDYLLTRLSAYGLDRVAAEAFELRGWERGAARLSLVTEAQTMELPCLALPGSPGCDLEAEILDVGPGTEAHYERLGLAAAGKIVFNSVDGAGRAEMYRAAAQAGAAAFLFSSSQPGWLAPTGSVGKDLPALGLAAEAMARLRRRLAAGPARARLVSTSRVTPSTAYNLVAEIPGSDPEAGWIVACGHYDGHDIGQAAQDNGAGVAVLMEAARLLSPLRAHLRAGIRFILFSGEELGLYGSYAYAQAHARELDPVRLVFNVDVVGLAMPLVLQTQASPALADYLRGLPLSELDAVVNDKPGSFIMNSDHFPFSLAGVAGVWAVTSAAPPGTGWVHTAADTLDKIDPRVLRQTAAVVTRLLLRMAAEPERLPRGRQAPEDVRKQVSDAGFESHLRWIGRWPF
jgi:Zn-dependent M28 family amino/carboxypeptidase